MVDFSSTSIPQPRNWQDFEHCCRILFECILEDPQTQLHGRSGQPQSGVDIFGRRGGEGGPLVGVQCKGKDTDYGGKVTEKELRTEVKKALNFDPPLKEFILATTAPNDVEIQRVARLITDENAKAGRPLTVVVWGWGELRARISEHDRAIKAFHPDATPFHDDTLAKIAKVEAKVDTGNQQSSHLLSVLMDIRENTSQASAKEKEALEANWHAEIDEYRDLISQGRPKTAIEFLEKLKNRIWEKASSRIRFRIVTNIGASKLELGDENGAAADFLSAITYDPQDKIGMANVVLAHLIRKDFAKAIEAARDALSQDPENENAASYFIQAHADDMSITDPLSLVPENLRNKRAVRAGAIAFLRRRGVPEWRKAAREASLLFPDADELKRAAAEAHLDAVFGSSWALLGQGTSLRTELDEISKAAATLQTVWDLIKHNEVIIDASLPNNLAVAYRILDRKEDAARVLDEALAKIPDNILLVKVRAAVHVEMGRKEDALKLLTEQGSSDPQVSIMTAELVMGRDPEKAREILSDIDKPGIDDEIRVSSKIMWIESFIREGKLGVALEQAQKLSADHPGNIEILITLSDIQKQCEIDSADKTLLEAKGILNEDSSFHERFLVARELNRGDRYEDVVELLDGRVGLNRDTPALQLYLSALINGDRRNKAHEILRHLPADLASKPVYMKMQAALHTARRDFRSAEKALRKYLLLRPEDLTMRLRWAGLSMRLPGGDVGVRKFLEGNVEALEGEPADRMQLAMLLEKFNFDDRALRLGYETFLKHNDLPEIHVNYIALLTFPNRLKSVDLSLSEVRPDAVFVIENDRGDRDSFLIEQDERLRINNNAIPPDHPIAQKALGCKVGDSFFIGDAGDPGEKWRIVSIKHKILDVMHRSMERFNRQFPSFDGFKQVRFDPQAPEALLAPVRARHDGLEKIMAQFDQEPVPLDILADILRIDVIKAWHGLLETGRKFRVCIGAAEERNAALRAIDLNAGKGCVVEALTFFIIRRLAIEDVILKICGRIGMTETSIDVFRGRRDEIEFHGGKPFMVISWRDGKYYREEISTEMIRQSLDLAESDLHWIEENCEILPAESDLDLSPKVREISKKYRRDFFDPILAAHGSNRLLLCEDFIYRRLASSLKVSCNTWLQPVLLMARDRKILSTERFDDALFYMITAGFDFISIDSSVLLRAAQYEEGIRFEKVAEALGGPDADMRSHISVASIFLREVWQQHDPPLKSKAQTGKLIECLMRGRHEQFRNIAVLLSANVEKISFQNYLLDWLEGHLYLPFSSNQRISGF
jgi:tetratricopeptide (TPR) repeat protein